VAVSVSGAFSRPDMLSQLRWAFEFAQQQVRGILQRAPGVCPMHTTGGKWNTQPAPGQNWYQGFLPSMMWMFHKRTGDAFWSNKAEEYTLKLETRKFDRDTDAHGLLFMNTFARRLRQTDDRKWAVPLTQAARTLAKRFQAKGGYLCSYQGADCLSIEMMGNVELLFLASKLSTEKDLAEIALKHSRTSHLRLVREDGGVAHEALFDTDTGKFRRENNRMGLRANSNWSLGLAWAIYGFGTVFHHTQLEEFLITAEECALYYLDRAEKGIVPWDLDAPAGPKRVPDSAAAAVAANGLWNLAGLTKSPESRTRFAKAAIEILETLSSPAYLAQGKPGQEGVLLHGVYDMPRGVGVDESTIWGDHYFVEGLYKVLQQAEKKKTAKRPAGEEIEDESYMA